MPNENKNISISWLGISLAFFICTLLLLPVALRSYRPADKATEMASAAAATEVPAKAPVPAVFEAPELIARAAVVYDVAKGVELFAANGEAQLPLASLTKIMTALTARETLGEDETVVIGEKTLRADGDGLLKTGDKWSLRSLLDWTLVRSSNDGAVAIASAWEAVARAKPEATASSTDFLASMNARAKELGLTQTYFLNETGLDLNEELSGAYGSARDVNKLFLTAVREFPESFEATRYKELIVDSARGTYKTKNTNSAVETLPGLIASKTGFTDLAGGNLVILFDAGPNHPVAISVLGSTQEGRFEDVAKLVDATLRYLEAKGEEE
ncbi:hypothetical protein K8Q93_03100 [Candidatus Parcubacteria bacterium]|nr:hypothetical protein [Candidatus Parcubacteria bacterium]